MWIKSRNLVFFPSLNQIQHLSIMPKSEPTQMTSHATLPSSISARDKAEDISFAVELKFLIRQDFNEITAKYGPVRHFVPHLPAEPPNSMTEAETRLQRDNWEAIAKAIDILPGVNATTSHEVKAQGLEHTSRWRTHWIVYKANSACPMYLTYLHNDPTRPVLNKNAPDYERYVWTPVEICSPILYWAQKEETMSILKQVIETVKGRFDTVSNPSTETHVHVGRSDGKFYSINTLKKLATILWLSEPMLRAVKDPKSPNFNHHYTWSYCWRDHSRIAMALDKNLPDRQTFDDLYTGKPDDFDAFLVKLNDARLITADNKQTSLGEHKQALRAIWGAADHKELGYMLRGPERKFRRLGFNFHALEKDESEPSPSPRTIEFRFLEGFFDKDITPAWARLCGELVDIVTEQPEDWEFYDAVVLLMNLPKDWPLDAQFAAFMHEMGQGRIPRTVYEPLQGIIRKNYPPPKCKEGEDGSR